MSTPNTEHAPIDLMGELGENVLLCSCGERIWPDCDASRASISQAFSEHVQTAHIGSGSPGVSGG